MAYDLISPMPAGHRGSRAVSGQNEHMDRPKVSNPSHHLMAIWTPGVSPNHGKGLPIARRKHEELPLTGGELCLAGEEDPTRCGNVGLGSFLTRPSGEWESPEQN